MYPEDRKYSKDHEWAKIEGNVAIIGITYHAQEELGDIVHVDLPEVGKEVKQNEVLAVIESVKSASDVYSPLSGKVIEINESLKGKPELINEDPYNAGWLVKLEVSDPKEYEGLLSAEEYKKLIGE
ncbi:MULTISPECIES: glycine cleavage system protein GcvH [Dictyoglomus]|jgi:glycine cleavage system H protein|uniref:Glycine cleavage system H protein n=1 Tax=Dictyoglomus turgidum (strain DSM 6724 / Z-1310) TaxID=515635 RepID=B8E2E6_DICTD|nr:MULTISPECIES: glycine cleavage system protein GcvH [Dictyoglomus]ACK42790.1 glycine cleavage system H protein [Dictyoglomus turgidum DSM 6724]PNV81002.1 MAG: glycine cleavage system protein H [Dictyoglomus turgidum]HBU30849.1 glycine cleavage system protein GcvH [Dictyoglomus sp.]